MLKKGFWEQVVAAEDRGASAEEMQALLGKGRAKKGIFEGDLAEGEPEIGQVAAQISSIRSVAEIMQSLNEEYDKVMG